MPVYIDAGLLYYRKDLLEYHSLGGPPSTWDELLEQALVVQQYEHEQGREFYGFVWQGAQYEGLIGNWLEVAVAAGGGIFDNQELIVDSPANIQATELMRDFIHAHRISPPNTYIEMREEETRRYFQQGRVFFQRNWPYARALHQADDSPVRGKVGIAPLPHFGNDGRSVATLGGWHIAVSRFSRNPEESLALVEYILS